MAVMMTAAVVVVLTAACNDAYPGASEDGSNVSVQQQFDELMKRPDIDEAVRGYRAMLADVRRALTARFNLTGWRSGGGGRVSPGCNDFPDVDAWDAEQHLGDDWATDQPVTAKWPDVVSVVKNTAARHGFTDVIFEAGKAEHREIQIKDRYGAELYVGTGNNTIVGISIGCHLNPDAKRRGTPTSTSAP